MYSLLKQHSGKQGGAYARQRHMARVQYIWPVSIVSTLDDLDLISQEVPPPKQRHDCQSYHSMATIDLFQLPLPLLTVPLGFTSCCFQLHSCLQNSLNIKHTKHTFHLDSFDTFYNPTGASRCVKIIAVFSGCREPILSASFGCSRKECALSRWQCFVQSVFRMTSISSM